MLTPYQYASNNPIQNIDLDGLEGLVATGIPMTNLGYGQGTIISVEGARKIAPKVAEYSKSAAHSFTKDVKSLGKLKTYTNTLDFISLMFVPDVREKIMIKKDMRQYKEG